MMIGYDISRILSLQSAVYQNFIGLFHLNELPEKIGCHNFAVINYSNHWFVIHHNLFDEIEVFNSLGENSSVTSKGLCIKYVSIFEGGGALKMLTVADMRGRGVSKVLMSALFANKSNKYRCLLTKSYTFWYNNLLTKIKLCLTM